MGLLGSLYKPKKKKKARSTARKGTTKTGTAAPNANLSDIEIPTGEYEINVEGLAWCKLSLKTCEDRIFSLTPRNTYQIEHNWPEGEILNVCRKGSKRTTEKNWVGYISEKDAKTLRKVVLTHGVTNVHAKIDITNSTKMVLLVPRKYK